jgi:hypothetical protein
MNETNVLILLANIMVLALNIKLYTEIFKDKSQDRRTDKKERD